MDRLSIKDSVYLIVMNTFHTEVTHEHIMSGDHLYRYHFSTIPKEHIEAAIKEMIDQGHLKLSEDGVYYPTESGYAIFSTGGYVTNSVRKR